MAICVNIKFYQDGNKELYNLRRYHIGRWGDETQWEEAVKNCAPKWLLK